MFLNLCEGFSPSAWWRSLDDGLRSATVESWVSVRALTRLVIAVAAAGRGRAPPSLFIELAERVVWARPTSRLLALRWFVALELGPLGTAGG